VRALGEGLRAAKIGDILEGRKVALPKELFGLLRRMRLSRGMISVVFSHCLFQMRNKGQAI